MIITNNFNNLSRFDPFIGFNRGFLIRYFSTSLPHIRINSTPEKLVFNNGKAVLRFPPLQPFQ